MCVTNKRDASKKLRIEGKAEYTREELERANVEVDVAVATSSSPMEKMKDLPEASWFRIEGVGGMSSEIEFIIKNLFFVKFNQKKLEKFCQVNSGLFMHGPPGSGKSFLARAIGKVW